MSKEKDEGQTLFYPDFLFKEAIAALIVVVAIVAISLIFPMKVGDPADPSDSSFKPRPEWYFMAPFYLLKMFPSSLEMVPAVVAPGLMFIALLAFPFFDKNPERHPGKRPVAMAVMGGGVIAIIVFTVLGILA